MKQRTKRIIAGTAAGVSVIAGAAYLASRTPASTAPFFVEGVDVAIPDPNKAVLKPRPWPATTFRSKAKPRNTYQEMAKMGLILDRTGGAKLHTKYRMR